MTDIAPPILFRWEGDSFVPANPFAARACDKHFVSGEKYVLVEHQQRSTASHNRLFACIQSAWESLPDHLAGEYPSAEKLRKVALIRTGYADSQTFVCRSSAEALRLRAFLEPIDEYSIVTTVGATVTRWTAKSQSRRAMGKAQFEASSDAVLNWIAELMGSTKKQLEAVNKT